MRDGRHCQQADKEPAPPPIPTTGGEKQNCSQERQPRDGFYYPQYGPTLYLRSHFLLNGSAAIHGYSFFRR